MSSAKRSPTGAGGRLVRAGQRGDRRHLRLALQEDHGVPRDLLEVPGADVADLPVDLLVPAGPRHRSVTASQNSWELVAVRASNAAIPPRQPAHVGYGITA